LDAEQFLDALFRGAQANPFNTSGLKPPGGCVGQPRSIASFMPVPPNRT
jgi:hypothetical protein